MDDVGGQLKMAGGPRTQAASAPVAHAAARPWLWWTVEDDERLPIAYVLAAGMGFLGAHRWFLGRALTGSAMLAGSVVGAYAAFACLGLIDSPALPMGWSWDGVGLACFAGLLGSTLFDLATMHRWDV